MVGPHPTRRSLAKSVNAPTSSPNCLVTPLSSVIDNEKSKPISSSSKDAMARRHANITMVQNVLLIWLDSNIDEEHSEDCRNIVTQLRRVINSINMFTDGDQCVTFLSEINDNKVCMIISGSLGPHIVPMVHEMSQVDSIFIFCDNKTDHEQWTKEWPKIKGIFIEITLICEALKSAAQECEHNAIGINFMTTSGADASSENVDQLDCSFMYTQILKEILLTIEFEEQHIQQFIEYCREVFADNDGELNNIKQFERKYRDKTPIWWYTYECFLYPMLNRVLRVMDVNIMIEMGFFIDDLHRHIEQLHKEEFGGHHSGEVFTVYRGQGLSKTDFEQMMKTKGGLVSFNNFLSTSKDQKVSLRFARRAARNPDLIAILFVMSIDPSISSAPFASINKVSYFQNTEDEVLFSMHTVFRIREIKQMDETNRLWQVELTLTGDNDQELRALTERMREETYPDSKGWYRLGIVLIKMGHSEKAQQVYEVMLGQTTDDHQKASIYQILGMTKRRQEEYEEAITFYEKSQEIYQKILPPSYPNLAACYNNIGLVYQAMREYSKALSYYQKTLEIHQKILPANYPDLANSCNNIGVAYMNMVEYSKALSYYEKAFELQQKSLPANHPNLAKSYNNIGTVYFKIGEYSKALLFYEKDLEISKKCLPSNHPDLANSYNTIGSVYNKMGEYSKALLSYEQELEIEQQILPENHPDLVGFYNNIGVLYKNMGEYCKALSYYEKAFELQQKILPSNHLNFVASYSNIGIVYQKMGEYSKALSSLEKAVAIQQKTLPENHPNLASSYYTVGSVYNEMGEYSEALLSYERAVHIGQTSLPANHPHLQLYQKYLDLVKKKL